MPFTVYVLYSQQFTRLYKGYTSELNSRLKQHNSAKVRSTKPYIPWSVVYTEEFEFKADAIKREKYFKTAAGRRFLKTKLKDLL